MASLTEILGQYRNDYKDLFHQSEEDSNRSIIYKGYNIKDKRECTLKIISREQLKSGDYDFLLQQVNREEEITQLCQSENIIKFYRRLETKDYITFELEFCECDLRSYFLLNDKLAKDIFFFKEIIISIAKALKVLHEKGVMHRDIKPDNIFIKSVDDNNKTIKLGDFGCSIYIKDNIFDPIGTIVYSAPEILKNMEYDEKCDLWSLGVTLYQLYFGVLPYGPEPNINIIMDMIYDEEIFRLKKTKIPSLDILFYKLLTINPKDRMNFDEFFNFVFNDNFMKKDFIDNNYELLYQNILKIEDKYIIKEIKEETGEAHNKVKIDKENAEKIMNIVKGGHLPDAIDFAIGQIDEEQKFNNIIYYDCDENIENLKKIYKDSDEFERATPGAFILCNDLESLELIKKEIVMQNKRDSRCIFNLITAGRTCDKIMNFLRENKDFVKCINKVCVYCEDYKKWSPLKHKYKIIYNVFIDKGKVIDFIKQFASKDIKAFPLKKVIRFKDYEDKYKDRHIIISQFYGDLTPETFKKNIEAMESLVKKEEEKKKLKNISEFVLDGFHKFDIKQDIKNLNELIIKEYTKHTFHGDLNKWLMNSKMNSFETVAYFTARLMYSLNSYGETNKAFLTTNKAKVQRGVKLPYSSILPYKRAVRKIILLSGFTSTSQSEKYAMNFSGRKDAEAQYKINLRFSVIFHIINICIKGWIPNGVNVQRESIFKNEREILFQPFSFYYVHDVKIDLKKYTADIYLYTVGKEEILEEKIKFGKGIKYNSKKQIMQVKS